MTHFLIYDLTHTLAHMRLEASAQAGQVHPNLTHRTTLGHLDPTSL